MILLGKIDFIAICSVISFVFRFVNKEIAAEIYEDQSIGSYVAHLDVRSTSSLQFEILEGNSDDSFIISPSTGVITTQKYLDYETNKFYNLSVIAINMVRPGHNSNYNSKLNFAFSISRPRCQPNATSLYTSWIETTTLPSFCSSNITAL